MHWFWANKCVLSKRLRQSELIVGPQIKSRPYRASDWKKSDDHKSWVEITVQQIDDGTHWKDEWSLACLTQETSDIPLSGAAAAAAGGNATDVGLTPESQSSRHQRAANNILVRHTHLQPPI